MHMFMLCMFIIIITLPTNFTFNDGISIYPHLGLDLYQSDQT